MECKKCGQINTENSIYCNSCGKRLLKKKFELKTFVYLKENNYNVKRIFLIVVSMLLLVMSIGPISRHNTGLVSLNGEQREVHFTQTSMHYLEGFKHFLLGTEVNGYSKIVREQILDHPVKDTFSSYKESYSNRNLVGYNLLATNLSVTKVFVILFDMVLIFIMIGFPLTLFVYMFIELQLKSDKKLEFRFVFLITGFSALFLSKFLIPTYSFPTMPSFNLISYIIISFLAYFGLSYLKYNDKTTTEKEKNILFRKAIFSILLLGIFIFSSSNFINLRLSADNQIVNGKISYSEASILYLKNYQQVVSSESTFYSFFDDYEKYNSTSSMNWEYFLRLDFVRFKYVNTIIAYSRILLGLLIGFIVLYQLFNTHYKERYINSKFCKRHLRILLSLILLVLWINLFTIIMMNVKFYQSLGNEVSMLIYPSLFSFIPLVLVIILLKKRKMTT